MNFSKVLPSPTKVTFKDADMKYIKYLGYGQHMLLDNTTKEYEVWYAHKNHASFGLIWRNTHLEYGYTL